MRRWVSAASGAATGMVFAAVLPMEPRLHMAIAGVALLGALVSWAVQHER
jgi:hypothetical protein